MTHQTALRIRIRGRRMLDPVWRFADLHTPASRRWVVKSKRVRRLYQLDGLQLRMQIYVRLDAI